MASEGKSEVKGEVKGEIKEEVKDTRPPLIKHIAYFADLNGETISKPGMVKKHEELGITKNSGIKATAILSMDPTHTVKGLCAMKNPCSTGVWRAGDGSIDEGKWASMLTCAHEVLVLDAGSTKTVLGFTKSALTQWLLDQHGGVMPASKALWWLKWEQVTSAGFGEVFDHFYDAWWLEDAGKKGEHYVTALTIPRMRMWYEQNDVLMEHRKHGRLVFPAKPETSAERTYNETTCVIL